MAKPAATPGTQSRLDGAPTSVLIIGLNYSPEVTGIAPYSHALARGLQERGSRVRVITAHPHYPEWAVHDSYGQWSRTDMVDGVRVTRLLHYVPRKPAGVRRLLAEVSFGLRVLLTRWGRPDVVLFVSPAFFATALASVRARFSRGGPAVVIWMQDIYGRGMAETGAGGHLAQRLVVGLEKLTFRRAAGVVAIHARFAEYLTNELGVARERVEIIPNWTHLESGDGQSDVDAVRKAHGWGADTVVLHAGNMGIKQGLDNVVRAARIADERTLPIRFVLMGNGTQRDRLAKEGEGIERLQFIGPVDQGAFTGMLCAADVLLVNELVGVSEMAVPSKLTSYFNSGRPVLAAIDRRGVTAAEVTASQGGYIVDAGDPQALVDAASKFGADAEWGAALGANGLQYRQQVLGETKAIDQFDSWLRQIVARRREHLDG